MTNLAGQGQDGGPKSVRRQLIEEFVTALLDDFRTCGKAAVKAARERSPVQYLRVVASIVVKLWVGGEEEAPSAPRPVVVPERKHERVLSPHRFR